VVVAIWRSFSKIAYPVTAPPPGTLDAFQLSVVATLDVAAAASPVGTVGMAPGALTVATIVQGSPVPVPPLLWAGSAFCVHQLAL